MKCIKLILSIVLFAVTLTLSAQDTALTYPATYVETVLDAATLQALSHTFSVDKVRRHADNTFDTRISLSYKEFDAFRALGIPYTVAPRSRAYVQMAQNYDDDLHLETLPHVQHLSCYDGYVQDTLSVALRDRHDIVRNACAPPHSLRPHQQQPQRPRGQAVSVLHLDHPRR